VKKVLLVDNYDSFTYNLAQYFGELGCELTVVRNDAITVAEAQARDFTHLVISPGPGQPTQSGVCNDLIKTVRREEAGPGRLPGPPVHRPRLRRHRSTRPTG
jgi:anthranilate/para-aminobenzoate synthase component II